MPKIITNKTDSLQEGEITPLIKTPFGFFICHIAKIEKMRAISFNEAQNQLIHLATRESYLGLDSLIEERAYEYYQKNMDTYLYPDTIFAKIWLVPNQENTLGKSDIKTIGERRNALKDTSTFQPITVNTFVLPENIRKIVTRKIAESNKNDTFFGPLKGVFGLWYFKIESRKMGTECFPFYSVKKEIIEHLSTPFFQVDTVETKEEIKTLKLETGLARKYRLQQIYALDDLNDKEIHALIERENIPIPKTRAVMSYHQIANYGRDRYEKKEESRLKQEVKQWMNSLTIYDRILFGY